MIDFTFTFTGKVVAFSFTLETVSALCLDDCASAVFIRKWSVPLLSVVAISGRLVCLMLAASNNVNECVPVHCDGCVVFVLGTHTLHSSHQQLQYNFLYSNWAFLPFISRVLLCADISWNSINGTGAVFASLVFFRKMKQKKNINVLGSGCKVGSRRPALVTRDCSHTICNFCHFTCYAKDTVRSTYLNDDTLKLHLTKSTPKCLFSKHQWDFWETANDFEAVK